MSSSGINLFSDQDNSQHLNSNTNINDTQLTDKKKIENNDILKKVSVAYDTANEIRNKINQQMDQVNNAAAKAKTTQTNTAVGMSIVGNKGGNIKINQINEAVQKVKLAATVKAIQQLDASNSQKAIIADMLNLTQKMTQDNQKKSTTDQSTKGTVDNSQSAKTDKFVNSITYGGHGMIQIEPFDIYESYYLKETGVAFNLGSDANNSTHENINVNKNTTKVDKDHQETNTKNQDIQNYMNTMKNKAENLQEFKQNLQNNIQAASEAEQSNVIKDFKIADNEDLKFEFTQLNKFSQDIVTEFSNFVETAAKVTTSNETESKKGITTTQDTALKSGMDSTTKQSSDIGVKNNQSAEMTDTFNMTKMFQYGAIAVAAICACCVLGFFGLMAMRAMNKNNAPPQIVYAPPPQAPIPASGW